MEPDIRSNWGQVAARLQLIITQRAMTTNDETRVFLLWISAPSPTLATVAHSLCCTIYSVSASLALLPCGTPCSLPPHIWLADLWEASMTRRFRPLMWPSIWRQLAAHELLISCSRQTLIHFSDATLFTAIDRLVESSNQFTLYKLTHFMLNNMNSFLLYYYILFLKKNFQALLYF